MCEGPTLSTAGTAKELIAVSCGSTCSGHSITCFMLTTS